MRYYVIHRSEFGLAIVGEVASVEPGGGPAHAETLAREVFASNASGEVRTLAQLQASEEGRSALEAWWRGDDDVYRRALSRHQDRIRREDEEELAVLRGLSLAERGRAQRIMREQRTFPRKPDRAPGEDPPSSAPEERVTTDR